MTPSVLLAKCCATGATQAGPARHLYSVIAAWPQLMATRGFQRAVLLRRAAQMLARSRIPTSGVNVVDIALVLLQPENGRLLAEPYYRRLDRAEQNAKKSAEGVT